MHVLLLVNSYKYSTSRVFFINDSEQRLQTGFSRDFVCETVFLFFQVAKIKGTTTKHVLTAVDSSCSWDTTSTSQAAFVFNCSSTQSNNRHLFALQNASLRECISIIHVSERVCLSSKKKKKHGLLVSFNSFPLMVSKHLHTIGQLLRGRCISEDERRCAFPVEMRRTQTLSNTAAPLH